MSKKKSKKPKIIVKDKGGDGNEGKKGHSNWSIFENKIDRYIGGGHW